MGATSPAPDYVFTLVHGTFAKNAPWIHDGSSLRDSLTRALAPARVEFVPFVWSGCNSHGARLMAGLRLRRVLQLQTRDYPAARRVVIAHSHGGNAALYALRGLAAGAVAGVVTLGTPFIEAEPADIAVRVRRFRWALFLFVLLLIAIALASFGDSLEVAEFAWQAVVAVTLPVLAACWFGSKWMFSRRGPFLRSWERAQERAIRRLSDGRPVAAPFLCISTPRDEARMALGAVRVGQAAGVWAIRIVLGLLGLLFAAILIGAPIGIYLAVTNTEEGLGPVLAVILLAFLMLIGLPLVLALILAVWAGGPVVRMIGGAASHFIGYGGGLRGSLSLVKVHQALVPSGVAEVTKPDPFPSSRRWLPGLRHSDLYQNPAVLALIATWASSGCRAGRL